MKAALFLAVGAIFYRACTVQLKELAGIGRKMPLTMAAFTIAGFGLVGTPGTAGFISKWYLAVGALDKGWWVLVFLIVASSLIALVYIGRVLEVAWLREPSPAIANAQRPAALHAGAARRAGRCHDLFRHRYRVDRRHRQQGRHSPARRAAMMRAASPERLVPAGGARAVRRRARSSRCFTS